MGADEEVRSMMWWNGWASWWWAFAFIGMLAFWGAIDLSVIRSLRADTDRRPDGRRGPNEVLAQRYARGEIDEDELCKRLVVLCEVDRVSAGAR